MTSRVVIVGFHQSWADRVIVVPPPMNHRGEMLCRRASRAHRCCSRAGIGPAHAPLTTGSGQKVSVPAPMRLLAHLVSMHTFRRFHIRMEPLDSTAGHASKRAAPSRQTVVMHAPAATGQEVYPRKRALRYRIQPPYHDAVCSRCHGAATCHRRSATTSSGRLHDHRGANSLRLVLTSSGGMLLSHALSCPSQRQCCMMPAHRHVAPRPLPPLMLMRHARPTTTRSSTRRSSPCPVNCAHSA
jgi:hypothetical protein